MLNELQLLPLADKLSDGMIEKIKQDGLEPELCEKSDKLYEIIQKTMDAFILKFVPVLINYYELNYPDEIDDETRACYNRLKMIYKNILKGD